MKWIWALIISLLILLPIGFLISRIIGHFQSFEESLEFYNTVEIQTSEFFVSSLTDKDSMKVNLCADTLVVIHYWGTWCKPCLEDFETFQSFYQSHKDSIQILVISEEPDDKVLMFLEKRGFDLLFINSDNLAYPFNHHHNQYPTTFFVRNCEIVKIVTGKSDWREFNLLSVAM
jgi:thiol-disulfide isomerase/thioredoxin